MLQSTDAQHEAYIPDPDSIIRRRIEEWQDLKFGLLMHWGPYSQWGIVESWSICPEDLSWATGGRKQGASEKYFDYVKDYENLQTTFNPVNFAPERWAAAARKAGMKYMVFTTKHHDGFCMFDTKYTDYKITGKATPFSTNRRSNIANEIFSAFRKEKFWIGAYFSKPDWHSEYYWWPKFPPFDRNCNYSIAKYPEQWKNFVTFTHNQISELMSGYGKLDILWLDGGWVRKTSNDEVKQYLGDVQEGSRWARNPQSQDINMDDLVKIARAKQPELIVVDRAVPGPYQNYLTPEQQIPSEPLRYPWETCMTMGNSWSYVPNDVYKPTGVIIKNLVDIVSKGGNYLLNIGPSPLGEFDSAAYNRLEEIGNWMNENGESIYATRACKNFNDGESVRYTQAKDSSAIYIFFLTKPTTQSVLKNFPGGKNYTFSFLPTGKKISYRYSENNLVLTLPEPIIQKGKYAWVIKAQRH